MNKERQVAKVGDLINSDLLSPSAVLKSVEPEFVNGIGHCVEFVSGGCECFLMSIYISFLALLISVLGYAFPRTTGGPVKWMLIQGEGTRPPELLYVGDKKVVKVRVFVHKGIGGKTAFIRDEWYPNDNVHVLNAIRTLGNPAPRVEVTWKVFGLVTKRVVLTG